MKKTIKLTERQLHNLIKQVIMEVRYIDTDSSNKTSWIDTERQHQPIMNNDKIRVFHGCSLDTARIIARDGVSGMDFHGRTYSYENGMNPLGLFVSTDFNTAKEFGNTTRGRCVLEFTVNASDLESPVWNGSDTYFTPGSNPMPFSNQEERDGQKMKYREKAKNIKDFTWHENGTEYRLDKSYIRNSSKPELANMIFSNREHQALFMGDLTPNMIKRVWVKNGTTDFIPMKVSDFQKKYVYGNYGNLGKLEAQFKIFKPTEDCMSFDDLIQTFANRSDYINGDLEKAKKALKNADMLQPNPPQFAVATIQKVLWPRQIIQLYGQDWFNEYFNRLGQ